MSRHLEALSADIAQRRDFCLHVAGLPVYWYTGGAHPTALSQSYGSTSLPYAMRPWLQAVGNTREEVAAEGGIARTRALSLRLATPMEYVVRRSPLAPRLAGEAARLLAANREVGEPNAWLRAKSETAAGWTARPLATIPAAGVPSGIEVDTDPAPLFAGGAAEVLLHVGQEAFTCTGYSGTGTAIDPYTLTGVERAVLRTQLMRHLVDGTTYNAPVIRQYPLNMRGRRVTVWVGARDLAGVVHQWQPFFRGVLARDPEADGPEVLLEVIDHLTRLVENPRDISRPLSLCTTHRMMDTDRANVVELALRWPQARLINAEAAWHDVGAGELETLDGAAIYNDVADPALPDDHPRRIPFMADAAVDLAIPSGTFDIAPPDGTDDGLVFPDTVPALGNARLGGIGPDSIGNAEIAEVLQATLASADGEVVAWPQAVTDAFGAQLRPGTAAGESGQWADLSLSPAGWGGAWALGVGHNSDLTDDSALQLDVWGARGPAPIRGMYGGGPKRWTADGPIEPADELLHAWALVDLRSPEAFERGDERESRAVPSGAYPVRGPCVAGYQRGERYISVGVEASFLAGAGAFSLRIDPGGDTEAIVAPIVSVTAMTVGGSVVGYALELDEAAVGVVPSFGYWPGEQAPTLTPVLEWADVQDPGEILASALMSYLGDGTRHATHDNRFGGLGLDAAEVDVESLLAHPVPSQLSPWWVRHEPGRPIGETIEQILVATGTALVWRRVGAQCRITRVRMGFEGDDEAVDDLTDNDLMDVPRELDSGETGDGRQASVGHRIDVRIGAPDGAPEPPIFRFNFGADDAEMGGESRGVELAFPGLRQLNPTDPTEGFTRFAGVAARHRFVGARRRRWGLDVAGAWVTFRCLGDVVRVTSEDLDGDLPTERCEAKPARIIALDLAWDQPVSGIEVTHDGTRSAGWAPSAQVKSQVDATTVELEDRVFCLDTDPITGEAGRLDIDYFAAGDVVWLEPRGDADSGVQLTIASVARTTRRVTFTGAHGGVSAGDIMLPAAYTAASEAHRAYAYITDNDGLVDGAEGPTLG